MKFRLDGQAEPSTYVLGCVNAIIGSFIHSFPDIVVEGPERLSFVRHYCNANRSVSPIGLGFTHNHPSDLLHNQSFKLKWSNISVREAGGDLINYGCSGGNDKTGYKFYLSGDQFDFGVTNTSSHEISARTNIKNTTLRIKHSNDTKCTATLGMGGSESIQC